jgi:hypothetical protein
MYGIPIFLIFCFTLHGGNVKIKSPEYGLKSIWKGFITQNASNGLAYKYDFTLEFQSQGNSSQISGISIIKMTDDSGMFAKMEFKGKLENNILYLDETKILDQKIRPNAYWCLKKIYLERKDINQKKYLKGFWESEECKGDADVYLEYVMY